MNASRVEALKHDVVSSALILTLKASFWCMMTTFLGFVALIFVQAKPLKGLGISGGIGTVIAIFISCLGLFGFSVFVVDHARKEIGIRKVNGATGREIIYWMVKKIGVLIGVSFILGSPIAYFAGKMWLQSFAYRITPGPGIFILAGIIVILVSLLTVSYQTLKAANTNPVDTLRYE